MAQAEIEFDFKAWRERLKWGKQQAAASLGISGTHYWKLEREGKGAVCYAWAAYGIERAEQDKAAQVSHAG